MIIVTVVVNTFGNGFGDNWQVVVTEWVIAPACEKERHVGKSSGNAGLRIRAPAQVTVETYFLSGGFRVEAVLPYTGRPA